MKFILTEAELEELKNRATRGSIEKDHCLKRIGNYLIKKGGCCPPCGECEIYKFANDVNEYERVQLTNQLCDRKKAWSK